MSHLPTEGIHFSSSAFQCLIASSTPTGRSEFEFKSELQTPTRC